MNIFEIYLKKIQNLIRVHYKILNIDSDISMVGSIIEIPPIKLNFDLSTNIALILAKKTKQSPIKLAESIKKKYKKI